MSQNVNDARFMNTDASTDVSTDESMDVYTDVSMGSIKSEVIHPGDTGFVFGTFINMHIFVAHWLPVAGEYGLATRTWLPHLQTV